MKSSKSLSKPVLPNSVFNKVIKNLKPDTDSGSLGIVSVGGKWGSWLIEFYSTSDDRDAIIIDAFGRIDRKGDYHDYEPTDRQWETMRQILQAEADRLDALYWHHEARRREGIEPDYPFSHEYNALLTWK